MKRKQNEREISSGAEKVESVTLGKTEEERKVEYEEQAAKNRVDAAKAKVDAKLAKTQRAEEKAKERSRRKEAKAKAFEREISAIEREKEERKKARRQGNGRPDGIGGWIAAVVTLGAITLGLTAVVTVGAIDAYQTKGGMMAGYRGTMYELIAGVEEMDNDLDRVRLTNSPRLQGEILTDLLVTSRTAAMGLERVPVSFEREENLMRFFNGVAKTCERQLAKLASGAKLTEKDLAELEEAYSKMHEARSTLDELAAVVEDKDWSELMKGAKNKIDEAFDKLENGTAWDGEGKTPPQALMPGGGDGVMPTPEAKKGGKPEGISSGKAEELCRHYFADYGIDKLEYAGELNEKGLEAFNFMMTDAEGTRLFAQICRRDGALVRFDYYKECSQHTTDIQSAKALAEVYLEKMGYENMTAVDVEEEGTNAEFTFAYEANGCLYYPDEVVVKVCEERGLVVGLDASEFLKNHRSRGEVSAKISVDEAREKLNKKLEVLEDRTVLFEEDDKEYLAHEFFCKHGEEYYFVYYDAMNGGEIAILNAKNHDR